MFCFILLYLCHAFDHYIADKAFDINDFELLPNRILFASDCWLENKTQIAHPLNDHLINIFSAMLLSDDGQDKNDFVARSVKADLALSRNYFSLPTEMMARAFEAAVETCPDIENSYLVAGTTNPDVMPVFPDLTHRQRIYEALLAYFKPLGMALSK